MNEITLYQSNDGRQFRIKEDCLKHEKLVEEIEKIMSNLPPTPDDIDFQNGHGYIQHDPDKIPGAMMALVNVSGIPKKYVPEDFKEKPFFYRRNIIGRILGDSNSPVYSPWMRFSRMDDSYKEYGQGYFALHPEEARQIRLNN